MAVGIFVLSCDDNNNFWPTPTLHPTPMPTLVPTPTPDCIELRDETDALLDFEDCLTENFVTHTDDFYEGEIHMSPPIFHGFILFSDCSDASFTVLV